MVAFLKIALILHVLLSNNCNFLQALLSVMHVCIVIANLVKLSMLMALHSHDMLCVTVFVLYHLHLLCTVSILSLTSVLLCMSVCDSLYSVGLVLLLVHVTVGIRIVCFTVCIAGDHVMVHLSILYSVYILYHLSLFFSFPSLSSRLFLFRLLFLVFLFP